MVVGEGLLRNSPELLVAARDDAMRQPLKAATLATFNRTSSRVLIQANCVLPGT